jgi:triosephosphate isomerase
MSKLFIGNWKMYLSDEAAEALSKTYAEAAESCRADVACAPAFTALERVGRAVGKSRVALAAQDVFWIDGGAYTGEISAPMLTELGVRYVIVGHSERRAHLNETDETVAKKAKAVQTAGMVPVVCVGETAEERDGGHRDRIVRTQLETVLGQMVMTAERPVVIAYEPRWAIGTGLTCDVKDVAATHALIREIVVAMKDEKALEHLRILYGGSVDGANIGQYLASPGVDGTLVGGASTKPAEVSQMLAAF